MIVIITIPKPLIGAMKGEIVAKPNTNIRMKAAKATEPMIPKMNP